MSMLPQHSRETNEHYTPRRITDPARATMGAIDLDPASCTLGQQVVQASVWYGDAGLDKPWFGRVFLNPPGGQTMKIGYRGASAAVWWSRLVADYLKGHVTEAIFVCFTLALFRTAQQQPLGVSPIQFPLCIPRSRVNYDKVVDGVRVPTTGAPADTCIVYLPDRNDPDAGFARFKQNFEHLGAVRD